MRLKKLIKRFDFTNDIRNYIELGSGVRLDAVEQYIKLTDVNGLYPLDTDLYVKTWATNPNSVKQWLGFECVIENGRDQDDYTQIVTGANFRLHNGTDEYWHNGASWIVDNVNWNTEAEIANNISDFPVALKMIGVVINPYTTDEKQTPVIKAIKILYSSDIDNQDDYIYRTIVRQLKAQVNPRGDHPITLTVSTNTIDLINDYPIETPYNIIGIDSVFNNTDDPNHFTDILQSYNSANETITLSETVDAGKVVWVKFIYVPMVAVSTGLEYHEVDKVPALLLGNINLINTTKITREDYVINKDTGEGVKVLSPDRSDIDITMNVVTSTARDQTRLADELKRFFANNPVLTSWGMDEKFRLQLMEEYDGTISVDTYGARNGRLRFQLLGTLYYSRDAVDVYAVRNLVVTGDMNVTV